MPACLRWRGGSEWMPALRLIRFHLFLAALRGVAAIPSAPAESIFRRARRSCRGKRSLQGAGMSLERPTRLHLCRSETIRNPRARIKALRRSTSNVKMRAGRVLAARGNGEVHAAFTPIDCFGALVGSSGPSRASPSSSDGPGRRSTRCYSASPVPQGPEATRASAVAARSIASGAHGPDPAGALKSELSKRSTD